jgi:hypothetical protein
LEIVRIENFLPASNLFQRGRPVKYRKKIARAFVAKHVLNLRTTRELIHRLEIDKQLGYICGFDPGEVVPNEGTFSRVFKELTDLQIPQKMHEVLTEKVFEGHMVLHCGRDSCPIPARETSKKREEAKKLEELEKGDKKEKQKKKDPPRYGSKKWGETRKGRQMLAGLSSQEMLDELPVLCDHGRKVSSQGTALCWRGYKLHLDVGEGFFPMTAVITSASTADSEVAIPLSKMSSERATVLYELMDKAYDGQAVNDYIISKERVPLIAKASRGSELKERHSQEKLARKSLSWKSARATRLSHRAVNERMFARLKDYFSCMSLWVRGHAKVACHVTLSVLCLAVDELLRQTC